MQKNVIQEFNHQPTNSVAKNWHGHLNLAYANRGGATEIIHNQMQAPLKVQRPFYPEGKEVCHSVVLHTAGGVVGGDRLSLNFHLQPNAKALITTAAAGKIYRSSGHLAQQTIDITLDSGANLDWLPQETIVFDGAIYRQDLRVELAPQASILLWEITRFGRSARGEKFLSGEWRSHTEIWQENSPLWIDRQWLKGGSQMLESPHGLAGKPAVATLAWLGAPVTAEIVEKVRALRCEETLAPGALGVDSAAGVTRIPNGLLCRYRGSSTAAARDWFIAIWQLLRLSFSERSCCLPRVWIK
ncbi:urease accessory protein UreD [Microcoleus sp. bin38.metabat.b11b12b14.051]|uniref:urease accessory protein UreD n=1 Tax=Microcoleus sp. bin38.metabat.b11b12b14.051 TaxID=2742709 RepID=UPI0025EEB9FD|nr:urease accessory protein UreD [Microcoleus sp. bin38.metabat.b11b12b14.051]